MYVAGFVVKNCNYAGSGAPRPDGDTGNWQSYFAIDGLTFKNITFCVFDMSATGAYGLKFALGTNKNGEIDKIALNNTTAASVAVSDNEITLNEDQPFFCYVGEAIREALPDDYTWEDGGAGFPKPEPTYTPPAANELTYNGVEQELITAGTAESGTMLYSLAKDGEYSAAIPKATEAGNYTVWYKVTGDEDHASVSAKSVEAVIQKAKLTIAAEDKSMYVGGSMPKFTFSIGGLVASDTLITDPGFNCNADGSRAGRFAIEPYGANAGGNYSIVYLPGVLTVYGLTPVPATSYAVNIEAAAHGSVASSRSSAASGDTVRLTAAPERGYELSSISVTGLNGAEVQLQNLGSGEFSFTMPACAVSVRAVFSAESMPFVDVRSTDWFFEAVGYVYDKGLMDGTAAGVFSPGGTVTRAMLVTILWRLEAEPAVEHVMTFSDVPFGAWYTEAVRWAAANGIVDGCDSHTFRPEQAISREQFAAVLWRYVKSKGLDVSAGENTNLLSCADFAELSEYAIPAMQWACGEGIINGTGDGAALAPGSSATRAEAAAMLMRLCTAYSL